MKADVTRLDDIQGGYIAARHLLRLGHRKIVYFSGPLVNSAQGDRCKGILQAVRETGLPDEIVRIIPWDKVKMGTDSQTLEALLRQSDCTAIIAFNDVIAYHCLNALQQIGRQVPSDVSLVGFDHIRKYNSYLPPLTSITTEHADLAAVAVQSLLSRIHQPALPYRENVLSAYLYDDHTTAEAPSI